MSPIYTKTGDGGTTGLLNGQRVSKNTPVIKSVGEMDELNAFIGSAKLLTPIPMLDEIQRNIYLASAVICAVGGKAEDKFDFPSSAIEKIENLIDLYSNDLPELKDFIFPGQSEASTRMHIARAVCRRVERSLYDHQTPYNVTVYFNRLSDLFFTLARWVDHKEGNSDVKFSKE